MRRLERRCAKSTTRPIISGATHHLHSIIHVISFVSFVSSFRRMRRRAMHSLMRSHRRSTDLARRCSTVLKLTRLPSSSWRPHLRVSLPNRASPPTRRSLLRSSSRVRHRRRSSSQRKMLRRRYPMVRPTVSWFHQRCQRYRWFADTPAPSPNLLHLNIEWLPLTRLAHDASGPHKRRDDDPALPGSNS